MMLRKRYIIETINDMLRDRAQIVHSRHKYVSNFIVSLIFFPWEHIASMTIYRMFCKDTASRIQSCFRRYEDRRDAFYSK